MNKNALNWFEIFVDDLPRAQEFYETILADKLIPAAMEKCRMALFPSEQGEGVGGALTLMEGYDPGPGGTLVYLNVEGKLDDVLARVPEAGGKVVRARLDIAPHGFIGIIEDTESNVVGLHSMV